MPSVELRQSVEASLKAFPGLPLADAATALFESLGYHRETSPKSKKGLFPKILVNDVRNLPVKDVERSAQEPIIKAAKRIVSVKRTNPSSDMSALEAEIDRHVYALYGLAPDEIKIVEEPAR